MEKGKAFLARHSKVANERKNFKISVFAGMLNKVRTTMRGEVQSLKKCVCY